MALGRLFQLAIAVTRKILADQQYDFNVAVAETLDTLGEFTGVGQAQIFTDGTTNGSSLTSPKARFTQKNVGNVILVVGAGVAGVDLATTIQSVTSANSIVLATPASTNVNGGKFAFGPDNTTAFQNALAPGEVVLVAPGLYMFGGFIDFSLLDNLKISGYGATFICAIPGAVGSGNIFFRGASPLGPNLALNANVAANQNQFQVAVGSPLSIGQTVILNAGETGQIYTVTNVAGASPQTVTVDRPILFPYLLAGGARVNVVTHLITRIEIEGLTFTGACEWFLKIRGVTNSFLRDLDFLNTVSFGSAGAYLQSEFSFNWGVDNVYVNGPTGAGMTSCEQCRTTRYTFVATPNSPFPAAQGFQILESANCQLLGFHIDGATGSGVVVDQLASQPSIPFDVNVTLRDGFIGACAQSAIVENGYYSVYDNLIMVGNGIGSNAATVAFGANSEYPRLLNSIIANNGGVGLSNNAGVATGTGAIVRGCRFANNTKDVTTNATCVNSVGPRLELTDCQFIGLAIQTSGFCVVYSDQGLTFGCSVYIDHCDFLVQGTQTGAAVLQQTNNPLGVIKNTRLRFNGGAGFVGSGLDNLNGRMYVEQIETILTNATVPGQGLVTVAGSLTRIGDNCNFEGCTTPVSMGGFCNRSINGSANANSVTLNGVAAVAYSFTDTKSTDRVQLILRTRGANPGNGAVLVAITPGTGITLAGNAALVNDVYDVVIR